MSKQVEEILINFDFEKVLKVMKGLNWEYYDGPVDLVRLKERAAELLHKVEKQKPGYAVIAGGFRADKNVGGIELSFILESWEAYEEDD
jgi:hypothetical protein